MIDSTTEHLVPIRDVPKCLPPRPTGKRIHVSAVYRWLQRGVHGIRLESIKIGGTTYTSREALQRFADKLTQPASDHTSASTSTTATRQRQINRAGQEVDDILGGGQTRKTRRQRDA